MLRKILLAAGLATGIAAACVSLLPGQALAQSSQDWKICNSDDDDAAIAACTRLISKGRLSRKDLGVVYYNRGLSLRRKDQLDRAISDYTKAIEYSPRDAKIFNNRGVAFELKRDFSSAVADYERAMQLDPSSPNPYSNRGDVHRKQQDFKAAIADYSRAISLDPMRPVDHNDLAETYMLTGQFDLALASAGRAIELDASRSAGYFARGLSAFYQGDFRDAASDLRRSLDLRTHSYTILYRYLARARGGEGSTAELEADATRLKDRTWPYAVIEMFLGKREPQAVMSVAERASEKCDAHYFIAHWQILHGNTGEHVDGLRRAAEICPRGDFEHEGAKAELKRIAR